MKKYKNDIRLAVSRFWETRNSQAEQQKSKKLSDQGTRSAVTGGKQLDGFLSLLKKVAIDAGVPEKCIYLKGNRLPGFFRPTKDWDLLIITPQGKLMAVAELKSQVGSFGNNFNNRTEEALGSALDLWTAFRENAFPNQEAPWLGYLMVVEKHEKSTKPVKVRSPHFKAFSEFESTSYIQRYDLFCKKLVLERHYSSTGLLWTDKEGNYGNVSAELAIENFLQSYASHIKSQLHQF